MKSIEIFGRRMSKWQLRLTWEMARQEAGLEKVVACSLPVEWANQTMARMSRKAFLHWQEHEVVSVAIATCSRYVTWIACLNSLDFRVQLFPELIHRALLSPPKTILSDWYVSFKYIFLVVSHLHFDETASQENSTREYKWEREARQSTSQVNLSQGC